MNNIRKHLHGFAEPDNPDQIDNFPKPSMRDRWAFIRYGPIGRVVGYTLIFTLVFVAILLTLWYLEHGHF